jgi:hypothetical protein
MKTIEKKKSLASISKSCKVYEKPKDHHQDEGSTSSKIHKCEFCNKIFRCGKGLGGHKRIHSQALGKEGESKAKANCNSNDGKLSCDVCKKNFQSNKALHGHMRSHPEREWRGMNPNKDNNIDYYNDDQDQYVLSASNSKELVIDDESKSWARRLFKTGKRGRSSGEVVIAAQILVYMSTDKHLHDNFNEDLDDEDKKENVVPSTSGLVGDIDETKLKNDNNKRRKKLVKLMSPCSTSKDNVLLD